VNESGAELCLWVCPNCGQTYFGEHPPDMCDFCADFTTWQTFRFDAPASGKRRTTREARWIQLPLPLHYYD